MSFYLFFLIAFFCNAFQASFLSDSFNKKADSSRNLESLSCFKNQNFRKICSLAYFPYTTNITSESSEQINANDLYIKATGPSPNIGSLSRNYLNTQLQETVRKLGLGFDPGNGALGLIFGTNFQSIRFSKNITIFGAENVTLDIIAKKVGDKGSVLISLDLPFSSLKDVLNSYFPIKTDSLMDMFEEDRLILIITNGMDFTNMASFQPNYLMGLNNDWWQSPGFGLYANVTLSNKNNSVNNLLRSILGSDLNLSLTIAIDANFFQASVVVLPDIVSNNLVLQQPSLVMNLESGDKIVPEIFLESSMLLLVEGNWTLQLKGKIIFGEKIKIIYYDISYDYWNDALGLNMLSLYDLTLSTSLEYESFQLNYLVFEAEMIYGKSCTFSSEVLENQYCLEGHAFVGRDLNSESNNWIKAKLSFIKFQDLFGAFGRDASVSVEIPKSLESFFDLQVGIEVYYSKNSSDGFAVRGNVFFLESLGNFTMFYPNTDVEEQSIHAEVLFNQVTLGNFLRLEGTSSQQGPYLNMSLDKDSENNKKILTSTFNFHVTLFGISSDIETQIYEDKFSFDLNGRSGETSLETNIHAEFLSDQTLNISGQFPINQAFLDIVSQVCMNVSKKMLDAKNEIIRSKEELDHCVDAVKEKEKLPCQNVTEQCGVCLKEIEVCEEYENKTVCLGYSPQCVGGFKQSCFKSIGSCKEWGNDWKCLSWESVCLKSSYVCAQYAPVCRKYENQTNCIASSKKCDQFGLEKNCEEECKARQSDLDSAIALMNQANDTYENNKNNLEYLVSASEQVQNVVDILRIKSTSFNFMIDCNNANYLDLVTTVNLEMEVLGGKYNRDVNWTFGDDENIKKNLIDEVLKVIHN